MKFNLFTYVRLFLFGFLPNVKQVIFNIRRVCIECIGMSTTLLSSLVQTKSIELVLAPIAAQVPRFQLMFVLLTNIQYCMYTFNETTFGFLS